MQEGFPNQSPNRVTHRGGRKPDGPGDEVRGKQRIASLTSSSHRTCCPSWNGGTEPGSTSRLTGRPPGCNSCSLAQTTGSDERWVPSDRRTYRAFAEAPSPTGVRARRSTVFATATGSVWAFLAACVSVEAGGRRVAFFNSVIGFPYSPPDRGGYVFRGLTAHTRDCPKDQIQEGEGGKRAFHGWPADAF